MASNITFNGVTYSIPAVGDDGWGSDLSAYFIAIASGALQKTGGTFTLTAEANFGATFGLKSAYLKSQATNPASAGILRLGNNESLSWRNAANNADLNLTVNASDALQYNGSTLLYAAAASIVNADISPSAAIAYSKLNLSLSILNSDISASAAISLSKLAALTVSRALQSNASTGAIEASSVTNTELGYLSGVTSAIQTQMNAKAPSASPTLTGTVTVPSTIVSGAATLTLPSVTGTLATLAGTEALTNKDIDGGTASNTSRITLPKAAKTTLDALTRKAGTVVFDTTSSKPYYDDGSVLKVIGSGAGGAVNFISDGDAEGSNIWTAYADAAGTRPVDGTGGSPTVTATISSTTPLAGTNSFLLTKGASNTQGQGIATTFSVDLAYRAKVVQIEFDYLVSSGTFVAGSSSADSDVIAYIYDVTNSTLIEPSSIKLLSNSTTLGDKFVANFQTSVTGASYRLILHCATTSASAYTLKLDNIRVGPSNYVYGTPITDWAAFTPTGSWSTNTTYTGYWRRVGDSLDVKYRLSLAGAPTAATLTLNLPTGLTIDSTKALTIVNEQNKIGFAKFNDQGVDQYDGDISIASATSLSVFTKRTLTGANPVFLDHPAVSSTVPFTWGASDTLWAEASGIPISGWSSSVQVSDSYDGRLVLASANGAPANVTALNPIIFPTKLKDYTNSYNASTGQFTAPKAGEILVSVSINATISSGANLAIYKNAAAQNIISYVNTLGQANGYGTVSVNAGDLIDVRPSAGITGASGATNNNVSFVYVQAPTTISATEVVAFMAEGASSSAAGSNVTIPFNTPSHDTHGGWNSTNKDYTVPYSGIYKITCASRVSFTGATVNQYMDVIIQIDGVTKREFVKYLENTGIAALSGIVSYQIPLVAGQKIRGVLDTNLATPVMTTSSTHTYLEILRVK